ncbi:MAG: helix-hairpin-helix domain-containing protein [Candidatus Brocadia sapporoensis]
MQYTKQKAGIMTIAQKPSDGFSPTKKQLITIYFLATTLFIGSIIKAGMDYHWWLPKTEIVSSLKPEDIKIKFDINTCPWHELVLLPALGETKAKAIVAYRERHGNFTTLDDLDKVKGMGASVIAAIRDYITVGSVTTSAHMGNQE